MRAYHIDRANFLRVGMDISFFKPTNYPDKELQKEIELLYPKGLSKHGIYYLADIPLPEHRDNAIIESVFEYERRLNFQNKLSRYQSFFASETLEDLNFWYKLIGSNVCTLWEIEFNHSNYLILDSNWLSLGTNKPPFLTASYNAKQYWSGKKSDNYIPELLISPPLTAVRKITL